MKEPEPAINEMNEMNSPTDPRLLYILNAGRRLVRSLDPDGLASSLSPERLVIIPSRQDGAGKWELKVCFPFCKGAKAVIAGTYSLDSNTVRSVRLPLGNGSWEDMAVKAGKTLWEALGPIGGIPPRLVRLLASSGPEKAAAAALAAGGAEFDFARCSRILRDALFWDVDGGKDTKLTARFKTLDIRYGQEGRQAAEIDTVCRLERGEVSLSSRCDLYGLSSRRATLEIRLGSGRTATVTCRQKKDGKDIPSIRAAFDLYAAIPEMYSSERYRREGLGEPAARKSGMAK